MAALAAPPPGIDAVSSAARASVLIVDDDPAIRGLLITQIAAMGFDCRAASTGTEALLLASERPHPDVVLSDLGLPDFDGTRLLERLRELDDHIQVVIVTGNCDLNVVRQCLRQGAYDYLVKPYNFDDLARTIDRAAERRRFRVELENYQRQLETLVREKTEEVLQTRDIALLAVAKLAECRDDHTGLHLDRIQWYSRVLTEALEPGPYGERITPEFVDHMFKSSALHDIGKVSIPDRILLKPGRRLADELTIMRTHTTRGGDTLRSVINQYRSPTSEGARFLRTAMDIAYSHHERWDGAGYPQARAADDIPLPARIVAVADAYDAITSARPYKRALSHADAVARIQADRGRHFDPAVVDAFVACEARFAAFKRQLSHRPEDP